MNPKKAIAAVERYRDSIVSHPGTRDAMSTVVALARDSVQRADKAFLVGCSFARADERERIARLIESVDPVEWALYGMDAGKIAAAVARTGKTPGE